MALDALDTGFALRLGGQAILSHSEGAPCFSVGRGVPHVHSKLGHFDVAQEVIERIALAHVEADGDVLRFAEAAGKPWLLEAAISGDGDDAGAGVQMAGDLARLGSFGRFVAQDEAFDRDFVQSLAGQVARAVGVVIADHPDQSRHAREGAQRGGIVTRQAIFGLPVVEGVA